MPRSLGVLSSKNLGLAVGVWGLSVSQRSVAPLGVAFSLKGVSPCLSPPVAPPCSEEEVPGPQPALLVSHAFYHLHYLLRPLCQTAHLPPSSSPPTPATYLLLLGAFLRQPSGVGGVSSCSQYTFHSVFAFRFSPLIPW